MRTLLMGAVMLITALAINSMAARHLEHTTRERAALRVLPPDPPPGERYTGDYLDGKYNGHGTLVYANGEKYVGEFRDNQCDGKGTYSWPDGRKYEGEFRDGKPSGQGRYTLPNGEEYAGDFVDNRREGHGAYSWPDRRRYDGEFHDDLPNGKGVLTLTGGQRQIGYFRNGAYTGEVASAVEAVPATRPDGATEIKLSRAGVNFTAPILLNGAVESQFYVDSGAADVLIPMDTFDALLKANTISQEDVSGIQNYRMANGSAMQSITFVIRTLKIGPLVLENVRGTVVDGSAPPLLGMSFLGRFRSWTLDNEREMLVLSTYAH
jgi:clan AA aspartic protease (TIGR02281 family)